MRIGFYESDITPPLGCYIPGYYSRRYAKDVLDRLYAKAMVVEADGKVAAILSIDMCEMEVEFHDTITKRIYEFTGIDPQNVCITANHSHYGGPTHTQPLNGGEADKSYVDIFCRLAADSVTLAYNRMEEAQLSFGSTIVDGISFCRTQELESGRYTTWNRGRTDIKRNLSEPDKELGVLFVEREGRKVGALVNYALHQDTTGIHAYSGDYSSELSHALKEKYGNDFVSVFVIGACGDVNHVNTDKNEEILTHRPIGRIVAKGVLEAAENAVPVAQGGVDSAKEIVTVKHRTYTMDEYRQLTLRALENPKGPMWKIADLMRHQMCFRPETSDLYIQVIRIGDVGIYIMPGEIFVNFGHRIKKESPFKHTMVIELANSTSGYIPTTECFVENSDLYETNPSYYSDFVPEAGDLLTDNILRLGQEIYSDSQH